MRIVHQPNPIARLGALDQRLRDRALAESLGGNEDVVTGALGDERCFSSERGGFCFGVVPFRDGTPVDQNRFGLLAGEVTIVEIGGAVDGRDLVVHRRGTVAGLDGDACAARGQRLHGIDVALSLSGVGRIAEMDADLRAALRSALEREEQARIAQNERVELDAARAGNGRDEIGRAPER